MNDNIIRTELLNIYTYLKYLADTIDNLLNEQPTEYIYQTAWLSKCLNLEEILTIFQNQIINKREKLTLVLDKALKELNNDVDTKIQTTFLEKIGINEGTKDVAIMSHVNALSNGLGIIKNDFEKKLEVNLNTILAHGKEIHEIKNYLQQELIPAIIKLNSVISQETITQPLQIKEEKEDKESQTTIKGITKENNNKIPKWINYIDEVKQKMKEKGWSEHEVSERAKINFNSFRKFQKKNPKLTNKVVDKILKLFDITY
jgi:hypothetical protein